MTAGTLTALILCTSQLRSKLETSKGDTFSTTVITDFLLGPEDGSGLLAAMDEMNYYDSLRKWTAEDWSSLLRRYVFFID